MAKQIINIGQTANDKSGDPLRTAFSKVNSNFDELYALVTSELPGLEELAQDYTAGMFVNGTHSGISINYNDSSNTLNLNVTIDGGNASTTF
jgi:hypothetical protein